MVAYDVLGNIALIRLENETKSEKVKLGKLIISKHPGVRTVLEKSDIKGRLRTFKTKHILGERNLIADYKENNCRFKLDIETCYFSPRLSNERKEIAEKVKENNKVLVMFAGVGPFPIVIFKISKPKKIVAIELGRECCKYFKENLELNKILDGKIEVIQGNVKKKIDDKFVNEHGKFDVVVMPRPNLKESFLEHGLRASKKNTMIYYHAFGREDDLKKEIENLNDEAEILSRKIKILRIVKAGEIAPFKYRWRVEIRVLN